MRLAILSVMLVGISSFPAPAQELTPEQLVKQLGSPRFSEREQASKLLRQRGLSALTAMRKAMNHEDPEIRKRVEELIPIMEIDIALEPQCITLNADKQPLSVVFKEFEKQTGYKINVNEKDAEKTCTLKLKREPFWTALEQVRSQTSVSVLAIDAEKSIKVQSVSGQSPFISYGGPFRLIVTKLHEDKDINFGDAIDKGKTMRKELLTMSLSVQAEPKLLMLGLGLAEIEVAIDENGKSLKMAEAPASDSESRMDQKNIKDPFQTMTEENQTTKALMHRPSKKSTRIKELRGFVPVTVVIARKRILFTDDFASAKGKKFKVDGEYLEITQSELSEQDQMVRLEFKIPKPREGINYHWFDRIHVEDAYGNAVLRNGTGGSTNGRYVTRISMTHHSLPNSKTGPPVKLFVDEWRIIEHRVPFEFKDVPLP